MESEDKETPVELPGVNPDDFRIDNESTAHASIPAGSAVRNMNQSGTEGFTPQLSGHAKAAYSHTSSFNAEPSDHKLFGHPSDKDTTGGQEEGGRERHPASSSVGRPDGN